MIDLDVEFACVVCKLVDPMSVRTSKMQATLKGYSSWVFERLILKKGQAPADVASYIVERWVDDNDEYLKKFGITRELFEIAESERERRVVRMSNTSGSRSDE
jgi:hypothetical protein